MSVELPWVRIASISAPRPVLFSGNQEGSLGGETLPVPRLGDRFAVDVGTAQLRQDAQSRQLIALLTEATTTDARIALRLPNAGRPIGGAPLVDGTGQAGSMLNVRGLYGGAAVLHGHFFNIVHAGRHYIHMATGPAIASADGRVAIPIWPMLRFITVDGEPCKIDAPMIEGQLLGYDGKGARFVRNRVEPLEFSIVERA